MVELTPQERLQPSLLDRLTDEEPGARDESRNKRILSIRQLRECVLRDLSWLLNTTQLEANEDLDAYPEVRRSTVNYGVPSLAGNTLSGVDIDVLQRRMRAAILSFEPRLIGSSLRVAVIGAEERKLNKLSFAIEGELWAQPVPLRVFLKTDVDLEIGDVTVADMTSGGAR